MAMALMDNFCQQTSLHGWPQLPSSRAAGKLFWALTIFGSIWVAVYLSDGVVQQFQGSTVSTTLETSTADLQLANFPKLVICNKWQIRQSILETILEEIPNLNMSSETLSLMINKIFVTGFGYDPNKKDASAAPPSLPLAFPPSLLGEGGITSLDYWRLQTPSYSTGDCCLTYAQSFESLVLGVKIQDTVLPHPADVFGQYNDTGADVSLEYEGASSTCLRISPNQADFPIRSGVGNGVQILLDLETFDNAHLGMSEDALKILVADNNEYSLLDLNGFTIQPGLAATIKIHPVLYSATPVTLDRFSDYDRRCVDTRSPEARDMAGLPYSLSNCLLAATLEQVYANCDGFTEQSRDGLMNATGSSLACLNYHLGQLGQWKRLSSGLACLDSCSRQENRISTSSSKFPNRMFLNSADFFLVLRKLWWSCRRDKNKFGPKRPGLDIEHPNLCRFYDEYIYPDENITSRLNNTSYTLDIPMGAFLQGLKMNTTELNSFKDEMLLYSERNLVKIVAYIEKVFAVQYQTDEVMSVMSLIANLGGMMGLCMGMSFVSLVEIFYFVAASLVSLLFQSKHSKSV